MKALLMTLLLLSGSWQLGSGLWLQAKAHLAQFLIAQAWQDSLIDGNNHKPWPWADTWPVARMSSKNQDDLYILAGAQGNSLAFAPGHMHGTSLPGSPGVSVVAGHRDTHFAFLQHAQAGDVFTINAKTGTTHYRVSTLNIVDSSNIPLTVNPLDDQLILVTCYPFNSLASGGPLRYVITADVMDV